MTCWSWSYWRRTGKTRRKNCCTRSWRKPTGTVRMSKSRRRKPTESLRRRKTKKKRSYCLRLTSTPRSCCKMMTVTGILMNCNCWILRWIQSWTRNRIAKGSMMRHSETRYWRNNLS